MTSTLLTGIKQLVTNDPAVGDHSLLGLIDDAAVVVSDGLIDWVGARADQPAADRQTDAGDGTVLPGFVDSHSHLVFAGDRSAEFAARMTGKPYDGGGIAFTVAQTALASDDELRAALAARMQEMRGQGTTTVEVKSGYGLSVAEEVRQVRLAAEVTSEASFLAHVVPAGADRADYVRLVCQQTLPACAADARWADVFCEPASPHAFDGAEARQILLAAAALGYGLRVHGNQLGHGPGVGLAVELGAASVDHCTYLSDADINALAGSDTVATLLPGVELSTRSPFPDGRRLLDAGVSLALATDCNPGTCYSSSMPFMIALAVIQMGLTPAEALHSATAGGARALRRSDIGAIRVGMRADLALLAAPSYLHLAYRPGMALTRTIEFG